jgi:hypothetical protein
MPLPAAAGLTERLMLFISHKEGTEYEKNHSRSFVDNDGRGLDGRL